MRDRKAVPALMFHSVGLERHDWIWNSISESVGSFEAKIRCIKESGFTGVFWKDLFDHMAGTRELPDDSIFISFDDGYLDNWVHVFPILRKYGMKGTVFVSPDFVDPIQSVRPNSDDVAAGRCRSDELTTAGFLNWAEMREMEKSGLVDIQSHAMTHTWYFSGPTVLDYHSPYDVAPYPWLLWNANPGRKPYYLSEDQQEFLPFGHPVFENEKSLAVTRFFPDKAAVEEVEKFVSGQGGRSFFERGSWRQILDREVTRISHGGPFPGTYESDEQRIARVEHELSESKSRIEGNLDKDVDYICWPGGANNDLVRDQARVAGYKAWTLSSGEQRDKRNVPGTDPTSIRRIGTSNKINVRGRYGGDGGAWYQLNRIYEHQGSGLHSLAVKAVKLLMYVRSLVRRAR